MNKLNIYAKSIIAALVAGLGALQVANSDGVITASEWVQIASVTLAALGFVWGVPNRPDLTPPAGVIVGESRPEVFVPDVTGTILPNPTAPAP